MTIKEKPREEASWERVDRNLDELLQELRIAIPGVQVLFAFLLAVPFQQRFSEVTRFQESAYFVTLLFSAFAMLLLIAPTSFHRLTFHRKKKARMLWLSNRMTIVGLACLALAVTGSVVLITDFLYGPTATWIVASVSLTCFTVLWFLIPVLARLEIED